MCWHDWAANPMFLCQASQMLVVIVPDIPPPRLDVLPDLQLGKKECRQDVAHHVARSHINPGILVHLSTEEEAAIGSLFADDLGPINKTPIIDEESAPFPTSDV